MKNIGQLFTSLLKSSFEKYEWCLYLEYSTWRIMITRISVFSWIFTCFLLHFGWIIYWFWRFLCPFIYFFHWWSCVMSLSKNRGVIPRLLIIELRCQGVVLFNARLLVNRYIIPTCMTMKTNGDLSVPKDQKIAAGP